MVSAMERWADWVDLPVANRVAPDTLAVRTSAVDIGVAADKPTNTMRPWSA
jgi:hypothetical protein